jgi:hypothetical protein
VGNEPLTTDYFTRFLKVNGDILNDFAAHFRQTGAFELLSLCELQADATRNCQEILNQSVVVPLIEIYLGREREGESN